MSSHTAKMARALEAATRDALAAEWGTPPVDLLAAERIGIKSARHLSTLPAERAATLRREWIEAGEEATRHLTGATEPHIKTRADAEWLLHTGEGIYD